MTLQELNQVFHLKKLIESLQARLDIRSPSLVWEPHSSGPNDKLGQLAPELADLKKEYDRLIEWIHHLPNFRLRLICMLRFEDGLTWMEVADTIGGKETEASVKKAVIRFLDRSKEEPS